MGTRVPWYQIDTGKEPPCMCGYVGKYNVVSLGAVLQSVQQQVLLYGTTSVRHVNICCKIGCFF